MKLRVMREQTAHFINDDPTELVLHRNAKVDDGAGGSSTTPTSLPPQTVKVSQQRESSQTERRNAAGEVVTPKIVLVMMWDADVQRDDTFEWDGLQCEVVWVTDLKYVKHAEVAI